MFSVYASLIKKKDIRLKKNQLHIPIFPIFAFQTVGLDKVDHITAVMKAVINGVRNPFPLDNPNACVSGLKCPLKKGQKTHYSTNLTIRQSYPPVAVIFELQLQTADKQNIICLEINANFV